MCQVLRSAPQLLETDRAQCIEQLRGDMGLVVRIVLECPEWVSLKEKGLSGLTPSGGGRSLRAPLPSFSISILLER